MWGGYLQDVPIQRMPFGTKNLSRFDKHGQILCTHTTL